jgi:hypothetical protein
MRAWLRDQQVWFADLSGNRFFFAPGLLIDREVSKQPERQESAPSVFADRSSLLLRYLLPRPPQQIGVRALARKLELSPAAVSVGLRRLQKMGHLEKDARKLSLLDRESLLEEWVSFYRPRFKRQGQSRYFVRAKNAELIIDRLRSMPLAADDGYGLSLHAGASLIAPLVQFREVHLYVQPYGGPLQKRLRQAAGAQEASSEANLVILEPFYRSSVFFEARMLHGVRVVSDLQLYLDLSCFPQRGMEQAQVILENRLRPSWAKR